MNNQLIRIENPKLVLKAAQAVWAANKYFVLACNQRDYLQIRQDLRPDVLRLEKVYATLDDVWKQFSDVKTEQLPQLKNALYHISGYFRGKLPDEKRQEMDGLIRTDPKLALEKLEKYTFELNIEYLQMSTLWQRHRTKPFDEVPIAMKHKSVIYLKNQLCWKGNYVLMNQNIE